MGLRRGDLGLFVSALAAAGLIVVFLGLTDGNSAEESTSTTTPPPAAPALRPGRLVRYPSPQVPDVAWSSARGAFSIQCRGGRLIRLDARIASLPADHRYAWRVITGDASETVPLSGAWPAR